MGKLINAENEKRAAKRFLVAFAVFAAVTLPVMAFLCRAAYDSVRKDLISAWNTRAKNVCMAVQDYAYGDKNNSGRDVPQKGRYFIAGRADNNGCSCEPCEVIPEKAELESSFENSVPRECCWVVAFSDGHVSECWVTAEQKDVSELGPLELEEQKKLFAPFRSKNDRIGYYCF